MNKDEILAKSRKENELSDERSTAVKMQGANFSIGVLIFLSIILTRFAPLDEVGKIALGLLTSATCLADFTYQLVNNKSKTSLFFALTFTLATVFYLYQFLSETSIIQF